jgi:hypothetical protein
MARPKYAEEVKAAVLQDRDAGAKYSELAEKHHVPMSTIQKWMREREPVIKFPGGSEYKAGKNGAAVRVEQEGEDALVDEVLEELAFKLGRQIIEIASLKARLKRRR